MAFPPQFTTDLRAGKIYLTDIVDEHISKINMGACECDDENITTLTNVLIDLEYIQESGIFDTIAESLYAILMRIMGGFVFTPSLVYPTVNTGNDRVSFIGTDVSINANVIAGSYPIASKLWSKVSGGNITMSNITTSVLGLSNTQVGEYIFKHEATDTETNKSFDTVRLTVRPQPISIRFGFYEVKPNVNTITYQFSKEIIPNSDEYSFTFPSTASSKYIAWEQSTSEPIKTRWYNTDQNYGTIGDSTIENSVTVGNKRITVSRDPFIFNSNYIIKILV